MPALSYKQRFVQAVIAGIKPHSIRAWRKRPFKVGDVISHFTGSRFKPLRIRPNTICTAARAIEVNGDQRYVILGSKSLSDAEVAALAIADGFASTEEFFQFFAEEHGCVFGQLIEWNPHADLTGVVKPRGHGEVSAVGDVAVDTSAASRATPRPVKEPHSL
jgi:hypothetical protein